MTPLRVIVGLAGMLSLCGINSAQAGVLLFWDFENATSSGSISTSVGTPGMAGVSGIATQTGGGPAEDFSWAGGGKVHLTRLFGTHHPFLQFTLTDSFLLTDLAFWHHHNHNPGFPTSPNYRAQVQIDVGSGFADIGSSVLLSSATAGTTASVALNVQLNPGTYKIRWDPRNLAFGSHTGGEYFALNDVSLNGVVTPEPTSFTVMLFGIACLVVAPGARRRRLAPRPRCDSAR